MRQRNFVSNSIKEKLPSIKRFHPIKRKAGSENESWPKILVS